MTKIPTIQDLQKVPVEVTSSLVNEFASLNKQNVKYIANQKQQWKDRETQLIKQLEKLQNQVSQLDKNTLNVNSNRSQQSLQDTQKESKIQEELEMTRMKYKEAQEKSLYIIQKLENKINEEQQYKDLYEQEKLKNYELNKKLTMVNSVQKNKNNDEHSIQLKKTQIQLSEAKRQIEGLKKIEKSKSYSIYLCSELKDQITTQEDTIKLLEHDSLKLKNQNLINENEQLQKQIKVQNIEMQKLKESNSNLEKIVNMSNQSVNNDDSKSILIKQLNEELERERSNSKILRRKTLQIASDVTNLQEEIILKKNVQNAIQRRYSSNPNKEQIQKLQKQKLEEAIPESNDQDDGQCSSLENSFDIDELKVTIGELKEQISMLNEEIGEYEENQVSQQQKIDELNKKVEDLKSQKEEVDGYYKIAYDQIQEQNQLQEEYKKVIQELQYKIEETEAAQNIQSEIKELSDYMEQGNSKIHFLQSKIELLEGSERQKDEQLKEMQYQCSTLENENNILKGKLLELEKEKQSLEEKEKYDKIIDELKSQKQIAESNIIKERQKRKEQSQEIEKLRMQLFQANNQKQNN